MDSIKDTKFQVNGTDLSKVIGIWHSSLRSDLLRTSLSSLGYNAYQGNYPSGAVALNVECCPALSLWASYKETLPYSNDGSPIEMADKKSCPIPSINANSALAYELIYSTPGSVKLRFDSSTGLPMVRKGSSTTWEYITSGSYTYPFQGVFVAIQAPGGGGGGGTVATAAVASQCTGGGGGGGGAFLLTYIDLKALNDAWPGAYISIVAGARGWHGGQDDNTYVSSVSAPGSDGGNTYMYLINEAEGWEELIASVGGGKGGSSELHTTEVVNQGGAGGTVTYHFIPSNCMKVIYSSAGKSGGNSGTPSGYAFGIGYGNKDGTRGDNLGYDLYGPPMLAESVNTRREFVTGSTRYYVGAGQQAENWRGADGQRSGGGGGGASICGATIYTDKDTIGYGMGGQGGAADGNNVYKSENGQLGLIQIYNAF